MKRGAAVWLFALVGAIGCDAESDVQTPRPPAPELSNVVERALAAPEAQPTERPEALVDEARDEVVALLEFTASASGDFVRAGREDLLRLGPPVMTTLFELASETGRDVNERAAAIDTLAEGPAELAASFLGEALASAPEPWVRSRAAWHLGAIDDDGWIPDALRALKYETEPSVVVYLAQALARRSCLGGLPALLVQAARDPEAAALAQQLAVERGFTDAAALERAWRTRELPIETPSARQRAAIWRWIARLCEFQLRGVDDARFVLVHLGAAAAEDLAAALSDHDSYVRLHACQCLERMGPRGRSAASELVRQLASPELGPHAAVALGSVGGDVARAALEDTLQSADSFELRLGAARGLALLADPASTPVLEEAFDAERDRSPEMAQAVAEAWLAADDAIRAVEHLVQCLTRDGLEPSSSGRALENFLERNAVDGRAGFDELHAQWLAIGARRGPTFHEDAVWRERRALLVERRAVWAVE